MPCYPGCHHGRGTASSHCQRCKSLVGKEDPQLLGAEWGRPRAGRENRPEVSMGHSGSDGDGSGPVGSLRPCPHAWFISRLGRGHLPHLRDSGQPRAIRGLGCPTPQDGKADDSRALCPSPGTLTVVGAALSERVDHGRQEYGAVVDLPEGQASSAAPGQAPSSGTLPAWLPCAATAPAAPGLPFGCSGKDRAGGRGPSCVWRVDSEGATAGSL